MYINVLEYLEKTVEKYPNKIGFEDRDTTKTFVEFRQNALRISTNLLNIHSAKQQPIGVYLPKSIDTLTVFMGILYSGNIYMPLDIHNPLEKTVRILNNIQPGIVITNTAGKELLPDVGRDSSVILIDDLLQPVGEYAIRYQENVDTDIAYIINTSGTTGTPKGVAVSHRSILDYIEWASSCYRVTAEHVIGNQAPFHFDNSVLDIYLCLRNGAKLVLTAEELFTFPVKLLEYYEKKAVTLFFFVPSVLIHIANTGVLDKIKPAFTTILFAGEVMPTKQLNYWIRHYPDAVFSNLYGPTEITVDCTYYIVDRELEDSEPVPIGKACRNSSVFLLDNNEKEIVMPNIVGELCVRGSSLACGYYNDREKTEAVFVQNPLHSHYPERIYKTGDLVFYNDRGELIFVGRKDFQIKHMGYRIELAEIEHFASSLAAVQHVCVLYQQERKEITMFYQAEEELAVSALRRELATLLPKYSLPTVFIHMERLPRNANGKIDRTLLRQQLG